MKEQMGFRRFLLRGLDNIKAETFMVATAFNLRSLYRVWQWRWNKTWKEGFAGIGTFISGLFLAIIGYCEVAISNNRAITC
jgi:hypothetical protein